jgi:hypothetical protein
LTEQAAARTVGPERHTAGSSCLSRSGCRSGGRAAHRRRCSRRRADR